MAYKHASYEEYLKASKFAKLRYRVGVYVQIIATLLLIYLLYYTITNVETMTANPKVYAEEKLGVMCFYPTMQSTNTNYGNVRNIKNFGEG